MKKGQASTFIIVAVVIILLVGLSFYVLYYTSQNRVATETDFAGIPLKAQPVYGSITNCLKEELSEAKEILLQQGGRINIDAKANEQGNRNALDLYGIDVLKWRYSGTSGIAYDVPTIESMQRELEAYIDLHSQRCFTNATYDEEIVSLDATAITTEIKRENIYLTVEKPTTLIVDNSEIRIDTYKASIPSNLADLRTVAEKITQAEKETYFLENKTMDIISVY